MTEIFGIKFDIPQILTLQYVKQNGILWNDDDFDYRSYWEGDFNHYERLFYQEEPFTGLEYELYPDGTLLGYCFYISGYQENENTEFYPSGQIKSYCNYFKDEQRALTLEWYENGQFKRILELTDHSRQKKEVQFDEQGNVVQTIEK